MQRCNGIFSQNFLLHWSEYRARQYVVVCTRYNSGAQNNMARTWFASADPHMCHIWIRNLNFKTTERRARALCTFLVFNLWKHIILNKNLRIMNNHHVKYKRARQCFKIEIRNVLQLWLRLGVRKNKKEYNITCTFCGHTFHIWILAKF